MSVALRSRPGPEFPVADEPILDDEADVDNETSGPDPDSLYEIVDGVIREKSIGFKEVWIATLLVEFLGPFVRANGLGRVFGEAMFATVSGGTRKRRPDVAFLSFDRWPLDRPLPEGESLEIAPDLAIEVVSPTDRAADVQEKVLEYFDAGTLQVWEVHRRTGSVVIHESAGSARTVRRGGTIDAIPFLPGFALAVAEILPELAPTPATPAEPPTV